MANRAIHLALGNVVLLAGICSAGCNKFKDKPDDLPPPKTISAIPGTGAQPAIVANTPVLDRTLAANELRNIQMLYFSDNEVIPPPGNADEFKDLQKESPKLHQKVKEGHYVVIWKANRNPGDAVLAYWKEVPTKGGPVVLVNGTVIPNMSPEEFKKAPKAGVP